MKLKRLLCCFFGCLLLVNCKSNEKTYEVIKENVSDSILVANVWRPKTKKKLPAIIVIGGSLGGIKYADDMAKDFAKEGFVSMSLAYFKMENLPNILEEIPLEYFEHAIDYLNKDIQVKKDRIGLFGSSKGAEAVLLFASKYQNIPVAVVANVPSHVVWQSVSWNEPKSSWIFNNSPVPFVKYGTPEDYNNIMEYYTLGLKEYYSKSYTHGDIEVEKINGPILITSGKKDKLWPSYYMANKIMERLKSFDFKYNFKHIAHDEAGHSISGISEEDLKSDWITKSGGTADSNYKASKENFKYAIDFFKKELKN